MDRVDEGDSCSVHPGTVGAIVGLSRVVAEPTAGLVSLTPGTVRAT